MPAVTYIQPDGSRAKLDVRVGQSVMDASVRENLPGIVAECGGSCSCGTCHVYVDEAWIAEVTPPSAEELELLAFVPGAQRTSRLACQIVMEDGLDGLIVYTPEAGNL